MRVNLFHDNSDGTMRHPMISNKEGLVCASDMTNIESVLLGYRYGLFPWYNQEQYGFFFFPPYRYIIKPQEIKIPKSIRTYFNNNKFTATIDLQFNNVIQSCMKSKRKDESTWITDYYIDAYNRLHQLGYAHSVEVWQDGALVGGLYGVAIGKVFTGESMFTKVSNASRFAMIVLAKKLADMGFDYIDCQVYNPYLASFGGEDIAKIDFYSIMKKNLNNVDFLGPWSL